MSALRRTAVVVLVPAFVVLGTATAGYADAPVKTAWWNAASANGVALPQPTTADGDLHVAQGPSGPGAVAAVSYELAGQLVSGALLQLKIAPNSAVGTVDVVACPTKTTTWKAGGTQPYDPAPAYDCTNSSHGVPTPDGTAVTFLLDAGQLIGGSSYSLAIVPKDGALPFTADFVKPDATSLTPEVREAPDAPAAPVE